MPRPENERPLPPRVRDEVQRILDREAKRLFLLRLPDAKVREARGPGRVGHVRKHVTESVYLVRWSDGTEEEVPVSELQPA